MEGLTLVLVFFLLSISSSASSDEDSYSFESCSLIECGGVNISYPFYDADEQSSDCSLPGFQVSCQKNLPLLNLSGDTYILKGINYQNQTFWIVNSAFTASNLECISLTSLHNFTLNNPALDFISVPNEIVLLQGCSAEANLQGVSKIMCNNNSLRNSSSSLAAVYDKDLEQIEVAGKCRWAVSVPYGVSDVGEMEDQIREGFALKWTDPTNCHQCQTSGGQCGHLNVNTYNQTNSDFQCSCPDFTDLPQIYRDQCPRDDPDGPKKFRALMRKINWTIGIILLLALGAVLTIVICCIRICIRIIISTIKHVKMRRRAAHGNKYVEEFIRNQESIAPKRYTYKEIKKMTMSFKEKLGEGGFSVVYKGKLLDGRLVAVKMLKQSKAEAKDFINEVASISGTNHVNVVTFFGFCFEGRKRALVYEFMPNGSLEKFTRGGANRSQLLSSETLFQIALGIARGLEYLHIGCNTRILHFDIKPHNILLGESFCPKISDFGLAVLDPQRGQSKTSMSVARGTVGYIAPEVVYKHFGGVSHKSDVYSYGMMVLEMIGCRENAKAHTNTSSTEYFPDWIYKELNRQEELEGDVNTEDKGLQRKLILVSLWCIQTIPTSRPSMGRVVQMLEGSLESIEVPPVPTFYSPPRPQADLSGSSAVTNDSSSQFTRSGQTQELKEIPSGATRSNLGVSCNFPPGNPSCHHDPIPTPWFSL